MSRRNTEPRPVAGVTGAAIALALLAGCTGTMVTGSANPSRDRPRLWQDYAYLPVTVLGHDPEHTQPELAAVFPAPPAPGAPGGRHIVLYVDAAVLPDKGALCTDVEAFRPGTQDGRYARVTAAMCDGGREVTRVTGTVLTHVASARWLRKDFDVIRDQLYASLYPGANDPTKFQVN